MDDVILYQQLQELMDSIEAQMEEIRDVAMELGCLPAQVRNNAGEFMITPLLLAKAQTLNSLALLASN